MGAVLTATVSSVAQAAQAPSLGELADTAALRIALAAHAPLPGRRAARVVHIITDSAGTTPRVSFAVPLLVDQTLRDSLGAAIRAHLRPTSAETARTRTALLITSGPGAAFERVTVTEVPPTMRDLPGFRRKLGDFADGLVREDEKLVGRELAIRIRLHITEDGGVAADTLITSSGVAAADSAAVRLARTVRFTPGMFEGEIVPMYVIMPIRFIFPDEPRAPSACWSGYTRSLHRAGTRVRRRNDPHDIRRPQARGCQSPPRSGPLHPRGS